jgi:hypothetical protein
LTTLVVFLDTRSQHYKQESEMNSVEAINKLNALTNGDPEVAHAQADDILAAWVKANGGEQVAAAYEAAGDRVGFWYA